MKPMENFKMQQNYYSRKCNDQMLKKRIKYSKKWEIQRKKKREKVNFKTYLQNCKKDILIILFLPKKSALQNIIESPLSLEKKKEMILKFSDYFKNSFQEDFMLSGNNLGKAPSSTKGDIVNDFSGLMLATDEVANKLIKTKTSAN